MFTASNANYKTILTMNLFKNYLFVLAVGLVFAFTSCSSDDDDVAPPTPEETHLLSQVDITFADEVKRPLLKFTYENNTLSQAIHYFYDTDADPDYNDLRSITLLETFTYEFIHSQDKISVSCTSIDHTKNDKKTEWVTTLITSNGYIVKAENVGYEGEDYVYTWDSNKLKNVFDYSFTYNGNNVESAIQKETYTDENTKRNIVCEYTLTNNISKPNPFNMIPLEFLASMGEEDMDMLSTVLCKDEVKQLIHTDISISIDINTNKTISEHTDKDITNYTYTYDSNNMVSAILATGGTYYKRVDYLYPEYNKEVTSEDDPYTINFTYIKE